MAQTGDTTTIAFATSSWAGIVKSMGGTEMTREPIETTGVVTSGQMTFIPADLVNAGEFDIEFFWDQSAAVFPPIDAVAETVTISYRLKSGEATKATLAGTGFVTKATGANIANSEVMMGSLTFKWDGLTDAAYTAGSA